MNTLIAIGSTGLGPIDADWTISELLNRVSGDADQHDVALRHPLLLIEAAVTGTSWQRPPSTVALLRSLASAVRANRSLLDLRVRVLLQASPAADVSDAGSGATPSRALSDQAIAAEAASSSVVATS
jgi:hypothetical protein